MSGGDKEKTDPGKVQDDLDPALVELAKDIGTMLAILEEKSDAAANGNMTISEEEARQGPVRIEGSLMQADFQKRLAGQMIVKYFEPRGERKPPGEDA